MRALLAAVAAVALAAPAPAAALTAHGSVGEAYVVGARRAQRLTLTDGAGRVVAAGRADRFGSKVFRALRPGRSYRVDGGRRFAVLRPGQNPPPSFYRRTRLHAGLNYVAVRDGIELAMTVRLPPGATLADGPFPTLVEYSGYQIAAPHDLLASVVASLSGAGSPADPLAPATATAVGSVIAPLLGFAVVSVQMRGSGCSGGAFDLFGLPTTYDGYDAVETVAAQPWVQGGRVGMAGISFSGITQLFTAGTRPPHLAAIAPMSVTDDLYATSFPGGIPNSGFAATWARERMRDARPAPGGGQPYAQALVKAGDRHCAANQRLRLQSRDASALLHRDPYRTPALYGPRSPATWMPRIDVPTFLVGQFQDEQTGGHFAEALAALAHDRRVWITLGNGVHVDSLGPSAITRWVEFLDLYVAHRVPSIPASIRSLSGELYRFLADAGAAPVVQSRLAGARSVAAARAVFERDPRVRVRMDNGAGPAGPGSIGATWELHFRSWPPRAARATAWELGTGGTLRRAHSHRTAAASWIAAPRARPAQTLPGDGAADAWKAQPPYRWTPVAAGQGVGFVSAPLRRDVVIAGPASLDLWLRSSAADTDLQATLSEVRPDGRETYVQNGWLRASHRRLDRRRSTALDPVPTHLRRDAAPLPHGRFTLVRLPVLPVAHAFRAGSRIRITVEAPGGDRPRWAFDSVDHGRTRDTVALGGPHPSRLVLGVVRGATAQGTPLPAPTALRGEPSRRYVRASNGG